MSFKSPRAASKPAPLAASDTAHLANRAALRRIMQYQNEDVIDRFLALYDVSLEDAEMLFLDTKLWLWLSLALPNERDLVGIWPSMYMIDEMWHNFILFTNEYNSFCHRYLGKFIHHNPTTRSEKQEQLELRQKDPIEFDKNVKFRFEKFAAYVYDLLGKEVALRWFKEYLEKYSPQAVSALRKNTCA